MNLHAPPPRPATLQGDLVNLPPALAPLLGEQRWVVWRWTWVPARGAWTKVPHVADAPDRKARSNDPSTWSAYETAVRAAAAGAGDGIGFMLADSNYAAFDLDDCRDALTAEIAPWARQLLAQASSYAEVTVSGTGLRVIGLAQGSKVHRKQRMGSGSIETYRRAERFIVVTGVALPDSHYELRPLDRLIDESVARLDRERAPAAPAPWREELAMRGWPDLPGGLQRLISQGVPEGRRSDEFHHAVRWLAELGHDADAIHTLLAAHPGGIAAKYHDRLAAEIARSLEKPARDPGARGPADRVTTAVPTALPLHWHGDADPNADRSWLVTEMIPQTGKGLLSGQWGTGKTFVTLDLSACVMTGTPFAGRDVVRRGGVLFIAAEGSSEIPIRLRGLTDHKLAFASHDIDLGRLPFAWIEECPPLSQDQTGDVLAQTAQAAGERMVRDHGVPLALIVVDTLAAAAGFADENDAAEGQRIMNHLERLSRSTGAFVLAVDHFGKLTETGTRGSSAKEAAADLVLALMADRETGGAVSNTRMAVRKLRGGATGGETAYSLTVVPLQGGSLGLAPTTCVVTWSGAAIATASALGKSRWPTSLRVFHAALTTALIAHGEKRRPFGAEGAELTVVNQTHVKAEFVSAYPVDGDTDEKRREAKKKAFSRSLKAARQQGLVGSRELGDADYLWLLAEGDIHRDRRDTP